MRLRRSTTTPFQPTADQYSCDVAMMTSRRNREGGGAGRKASRSKHADEVGLDAFGVGEHHRREFLDSAPAVILGAAAVRTERIRLTSAVTVLSAEDPVRA